VGKRRIKIAASKSARYRTFISERDKALEVILNKSRAQMHDNLRGAFQAIKEKIAYRYSTAAPESMSFDSSQFLTAIDDIIKKEFGKTAALLGGIFIRLKMFSYVLASTAEAEAIGQARNKATKYNITRNDALENAISNSRGENIGARIQLAFDRLRRRILDAVQLARVQRASVAEMMAKVDRALPGGAFIKRPKPVLKRIKEAAQTPPGFNLNVPDDGPEKVSLSFGFVDDDAWSEMVDFYLTEYVPTYRYRGPESDSDYFYKDWEMERDITHEFVASVRAGQNEAARQNGITDFQWIAVVDDRTCEDCCDDYGCVDFDGKSTREIEELTGGEVSVPPAHINCRCTIAPLLDTMPEAPASNAEEFDEWLNS
jgi:hypothetical protein